MLACARLGAVHSVVFGGFAADELATPHRRRAAEGRRHRLVRDRAGPRRRVQAAARRGDRPGRGASRSAASSSSGRRSRRSSSPGGTSTGTEAVAGAEPARVRPGRGDRPALHPLHVGHDRAAEGHRPRQRRPRGRARVVDDEHLRRRSRARSTGPRPTSAGSSATRTSSTRRSSTAARRCSTRASRSARRTPARSGG